MSAQGSNVSNVKGKSKEAAVTVEGNAVQAAPDALLHCSQLQAVILGIGLFMAERQCESAL